MSLNQQYKNESLIAEIVIKNNLSHINTMVISDWEAIGSKIEFNKKEIGCRYFINICLNNKIISIKF